MPAKFLVVDDHPLFLEAVQIALQSAYPEAQIVEATSVASAKEAMFAHDRFDLILLDLSMPGTKRIRGSSGAPDDVPPAADRDRLGARGPPHRA